MRAHFYDVLRGCEVVACASGAGGEDKGGDVKVGVEIVAGYMAGLIQGDRVFVEIARRE